MPLNIYLLEIQLTPYLGDPILSLNSSHPPCHLDDHLTQGVLTTDEPMYYSDHSAADNSPHAIMLLRNLSPNQNVVYDCNKEMHIKSEHEDEEQQEGMSRMISLQESNEQAQQYFWKNNISILRKISNFRWIVWGQN